MKQYLSLFTLFFLMSTSLAFAQQDCEAMQAQGSQLAQAAQQRANAYDQYAIAYNATLKEADNIRTQNADMDAAWVKLVAARDQLKQAGEKTLSALATLHDFNLQFVAAGCVSVPTDTINAEYQQSIAPFQSNMVTLAKIPNDWRKYGANSAKPDKMSCLQLADKMKAIDANGRAFADKFDPLIADYDKKHEQLLLVPDHSKPVYSKLRNQLITARGAALPGVKGYPAVLQAMYDITLRQHAAGCINLNDNAMANYKTNNSQLLAEIKAKLQEMENLEITFPAPTVSRSPSESVAILQVPDIPAGNLDIRLRNASSSILCLLQDTANEAVCNFFPGQMREVHASQVRVFGGGYWTPEGQYSDMTLCRDFTQVSGDREQIVRMGLEANCSAPIMQGR